MSVSPGSIHAGYRLFAWMFPAPPLDRVTSLSLEELTAQDRAYARAPFDVAKALRWIVRLGCLPLVVLLTLMIDQYTVFTDDAVTESPFRSLGAHIEHPYTDVRGVYEVRGDHARFTDKVAPFRMIVFADGTRWESAHGTGGPKLERLREITRFVADRSGVAVREVAFIEDVPARTPEAIAGR